MSKYHGFESHAHLRYAFEIDDTELPLGVEFPRDDQVLFAGISEMGHALVLFRDSTGDLQEVNALFDAESDGGLGGQWEPRPLPRESLARLFDPRRFDRGFRRAFATTVVEGVQ